MVDKIVHDLSKSDDLIKKIQTQQYEKPENLRNSIDENVEDNVQSEMDAIALNQKDLEKLVPEVDNVSETTEAQQEDESTTLQPEEEKTEVPSFPFFNFQFLFNISKLADDKKEESSGVDQDKPFSFRLNITTLGNDKNEESSSIDQDETSPVHLNITTLEDDKNDLEDDKKKDDKKEDDKEIISVDYDKFPFFLLNIGKEVEKIFQSEGNVQSEIDAISLDQKDLEKLVPEVDNVSETTEAQQEESTTLQPEEEKTEIPSFPFFNFQFLLNLSKLADDKKEESSGIDQDKPFSLRLNITTLEDDKEDLEDDKKEESSGIDQDETSPVHLNITTQEDDKNDLEDDKKEDDKKEDDKKEDDKEIISVDYDKFPLFLLNIGKEVEKILQSVLHDENNDEEVKKDETRKQENSDKLEMDLSMLKLKNENPENQDTAEETTDAKIEVQTDKPNEEIMEIQDDFVSIVTELPPIKESTVESTEANGDQISSTVSNQEESQTAETERSEIQEVEVNKVENLAEVTEKSVKETQEIVDQTEETKNEYPTEKTEALAEEPVAVKLAIEPLEKIVKGEDVKTQEPQEIVVLDMPYEPSDETFQMLQNVKNIVGTVEQQSKQNIQDIRNLFRTQFKDIQSEIKDGFLDVKDQIIHGDYTSDLLV